MNVWLLQTGESLPSDPGVRVMRSALLARTLAARGHSVVWWASAFDHSRKRFICETDSIFKDGEHVEIRCLKGCGYSRNLSLRRFLDHRIVARRFARAARQEPKPDVMIASTPPHDAAYEAVRYGNEVGIPVILDIRDPWPDLFLDAFPKNLRPVARGILKGEFQLMERACRGAAAIVAVTSSFLDLGLRYARRDASSLDKVFHLGYERRIDWKRRPELVEDIRLKCQGRFVVLFIGAFCSSHDPRVLISAAERLQQSDVMFVIAGDGELYRAVARRARDLNNVILPGWLNQQEIDHLLGVADVGVCSTSKLSDLFPNKAFLYLSAGLPVVSAFQGDLKDWIEREHIGFHFKYGDGADLAERIRTLRSDPALRGIMSANARAVFERECRSSVIYDRYASHVEAVVSERGREPVGAVVQ